MEWVQAQHADIGEILQDTFSDSLILGQALADRGLHTRSQFSAFLDPDQYRPSSPFSFPQMEKVVKRIAQAIDDKQTIGIWGDFDVDGQTSTAILVDGLTRFGANTAFHIPNRETESHGVDLSGFKKFISQYQPNLVITCDTGISETESIAFANTQGIDVIITDHHTIPENTPDAYAIINPHQLHEHHPLSFLAGVGTAFQVICALSETYADIVDPAKYLDLVALGTIADIAVLQKENRYYCQFGIEMMNKSLRPALKEIISISRSKAKNITENTIGFTLAPRLNAAGRLSDANPIVNFLISRDPAFCRKIALELEELNDTRKQSVENVLSSAEETIRNTLGILNRSIFILSDPKWKGGVLGIAAGRLKDIYNRPVILLHEKDGHLSGSARSIKGINITSAIARQSALLTRYGGHAMAAGLRISKNNYSKFVLQMEKTISQLIGEIAQQPDLQISHTINFSDINSKLIEELTLLSPFGSGNNAPIFASKKLEIISQKSLGKQKKHQRINLRDGNDENYEIIHWNASKEDHNFDLVNIAYTIQLEKQKNNKAASLELVDIQEYEPDEKTIDILTFNTNWEDFRNTYNPGKTLANLCEDIQDIQIWYEGTENIGKEFETKTRNQITVNNSLVILCAPPDFSVLHGLLQASKAKQVYLFDFPHPKDKIEDILLSFGGRIKYHIKSDTPRIDLDELAARENLSLSTTRIVLEWFQAHGDIQFVNEKNNSIEIICTKRQPRPNLAQITQNLNKSLKETTAFRDYYSRVKPEFLFRKTH